MMGTNNRIFALAAADDKTQAPEIESLFAKWQTLHAVRSGLVTLGFGLGLYTLI